MRAADVAASTGTWRIPVRMGAQQADITGHFQYEPAGRRRLCHAAGDNRPASGGHPVQGVPGKHPGDPADGHGAPRYHAARPGWRGTRCGSAALASRSIRAAAPGASGDRRSARSSTRGRRAGYQSRAARRISGWNRAAGTDAATASHPDIAWRLPLRVDGVSYVIQGIAAWKTVEHKEMAAR